MNVSQIDPESNMCDEHVDGANMLTSWQMFKFICRELWMFVRSA